MSAKLLSVGDVNIPSNSFEAVIAYQLSWQHSNVMIGTVATDGSAWAPDISFDNATNIERVVDQTHRKGHHWRRDVKVHAKFTSAFCMRHFPFDTQRIEVIWRAADNFAFDVAPIVSLSEKAALVKYDMQTSVELHACSDRRVLAMTTHIRRKYAFYMWNVVFPLFLLGTIAVSSFYISPESVEQRLGICVTLCLSVLVMMLSHSSQTKVPYLTVLHIYYLFCLAWVFAIGVANLLVTSAGFRDVTYWNSIFRAVSAGLWSTSHALVLIYFWLWNSVGCRSPYALLNPTKSNARKHALIAAERTAHAHRHRQEHHRGEHGRDSSRSRVASRRRRRRLERSSDWLCRHAARRLASLLSHRAVATTPRSASLDVIEHSNANLRVFAPIIKSIESRVIFHLKFLLASY
jgi:hypothetical protein